MGMNKGKYKFSALRCREVGRYYPNKYSCWSVPRLEIVSFINFNFGEEPNTELIEYDNCGDEILLYDIELNDFYGENEYDEIRDAIYPRYFLDKDHFNQYWKPLILESN